MNAQQAKALRAAIKRQYRLDLESVSAFGGHGPDDFAAIVFYSEEEQMRAYDILTTPGCPFEATYETASRIFIQMAKGV